MTQLLYRRVLLPAFEGGFKRRATFRYLHRLEKTQWSSREELERQQLESLRNLLTHAAAHCPYYRRHWQELGLVPQSLQSLRDFHLWPRLDRATLRANRLELRAEIPGMRLIAKATGGSSGVPVGFDINTDSNDRRVAASYRGYDWAGGGPGTRQVHLWGIPLGKLSRFRRWKEFLYHRCQRRCMLNSFQLSDSTVPQFLAELNRFRPDVIVAYTNALFSFARSLERTGRQPFSPRAVIVGAEKIHDFQRELIERVFQAPVFETYGSREFMLIGAECERHEGLHLTSEHLLLEILDAEGQPAAPGEEGEIHITDLFNYGMPFIRYATGDRGVAAERSCACGRGLPLLDKVVGRQVDMLRTADGRTIPGVYFPHLMKEFPAVERFQVVQEELDRVQLKLVVREDWSTADARRLDEEVAQVLGPATRFEVQQVDEIPLTAAGKLQVVVNRIN